MNLQRNSAAGHAGRCADHFKRSEMDTDTGRDQKGAADMKVDRHSKIVELIGKYQIETQEELAEYLKKAGYHVTQATVSRDIRELKLTKAPGKNGRECYAVMQHQKDFGEKYIRIFRDCYVSMDMAQNILVIKTVSGMAMAVAEALDVIGFHEIVGCVAGDNTIMCAVRTVDDTIILMDKLKKIIEGK